VGAADIRALRAAGVTAEQIEDAIFICGIYNTIGRVADALGFEIPGQGELVRMSRFLLVVGYRA
jgi:alkylhydroperoxidase family enzyme